MRLHTNLYEFGWHTSANSARMKNSRDLILGEAVYIAIIYHIPDSWIFAYWMVTTFSFDHMTGENREYSEVNTVGRGSRFSVTTKRSRLLSCLLYGLWIKEQKKYSSGSRQFTSGNACVYRFIHRLKGLKPGQKYTLHSTWTAVDLKKKLNLSPRYGHVKLVSKYLVLAGANWSQHGCPMSKQYMVNQACLFGVWPSVASSPSCVRAHEQYR